MERLPTLYKLTSTGKVQMWDISLRPTNPGPFGAHMPTDIVTLYGLVDGKKQEARETISVGKNIGKANETTPFEQAGLEAKSRWDKKRKKGYVLDVDKAGTVDSEVIAGGVEPMLAKSFDKDGHKISFPAFVQPKLDGHRCIAMVIDGKATLWSRTRKRINSMPHIVAQLERMFPDVDITLDGELYNHSHRDKFEQLTSLIRQETPKPGCEVVQYHVYDVVVDGPFSQRNKLMHQIGLLAREHEAYEILPLLTEEVEDEVELMKLFQTFLDYGFEGLMVRTLLKVDNP